MPGRLWFGLFLGTLQNSVLWPCHRVHAFSVPTQFLCGWLGPGQASLSGEPEPHPWMLAHPSITHQVGQTQHWIGRAVHQSHTGWTNPAFDWQNCPSITHWVGLTQHLIGRAVHQSRTGGTNHLIGQAIGGPT